MVCEFGVRLVLFFHRYETLREGDFNLGFSERFKEVDTQGRGACKVSYVAKMAGFDKARNYMAANHCGWFEKIARGIYGLTPSRRAGVGRSRYRRSVDDVGFTSVFVSQTDP